MNARTLWTRQLHQRGAPETLAVAGEHVVVHERRTWLVCIDRREGAVRWSARVGTRPYGVITAAPAIASGPETRDSVLVQESGRLSCFRLTSGAEVWSVGLPRWCRGPVVAGGTVVTGGWRGYTPLSAFRLADGRPLWRTTEPVRTAKPVAWGGGVLIGSGTEVRLIGPGSGRELSHWRLPGPLTETDHRPVFTVIDEDRCLVRCGSRSLVSLRLSSGQVEQFLRHDTDLAATAAEFVDGVVWVREARAAPDGTCGRLALEPEDGGVAGRVEAREPLMGGVVPVPGAVPGAISGATPGRVPETRFAAVGDSGVLYLLERDGRIARRIRSRPRGRALALRGLGDDALAVVGRGTLRAVALTL